VIDHILELSPEAIFSLILVCSVLSICAVAILRALGKYGVVILFLLVIAAAVLNQTAGGVVGDMLKGKV
jgi:hypothetical protein